MIAFRQWLIVIKKCQAMGKHTDYPTMSPYLVRVDWIKAFTREEAYWEKGLFAIQHTACRLQNQFTIEQRTRHFGIED